MAEFSALPIFTDALTADTAHLDDREFGAYMRLLILMWRSPECRIPHDKSWIGRRFPQSIDLIDALLVEFCQTDGNWWFQKRLKKEFNYVRKRNKKQSEAANSRWNKEKLSSHGNASAGITPSPSPSPSPSKGESNLNLPLDNNLSSVGAAPDGAAKTPQKEKSGGKTGKRIDPKWEVSEKDGFWAEDQGLTRNEIISEGEAFLDYFTAKAGKDAVKLDWSATWRNWVRNYLKYKSQRKKS